MKTRVLVADDDDGYRIPIINILEDHGYSVRSVASKDDVLSNGTDADILVIDARLPSQEMEGIAAVRELAESGKQCTVVFISVLPEDLAKKDLAAMSGLNVRYVWLVKPFELQRLLEEIEGISHGDVR